MISIIIPFYNEAKNLPILLKEIKTELTKLNKEYEVVLVDDGSTDNYKLSTSHDKVDLLIHKKRLGKGQALATGLKKARGEIIVFMDGDLQDDPSDIKIFLSRIEDGIDFVNGIRTERQDNFIVKLYSNLAKLFLQKFLKSPYTDINCGFKAFKKETVEGFIFYGNNFRFLPLSVFLKGYKVDEVRVTNRPRQFGKSKFGANKLLFGVFDTLTAYFIFKFAERPLYFFGPIGGLFFIIGFLVAFYLSFERIFFGVLLYRRPILQLTILLMIVGIQIVMTGIIGELIVFLSHRDKKLS